MIPAAFEYVAPDSLGEALARLNQEGDDAKILAGGHSLLPLMKLRLAAPELVIDLGRIAELRYIRRAVEQGASGAGGATHPPGHSGSEFLEIGAMTPYAEIENSPLVRELVPMLAQAAGLVGDAQVRHRGTIGGALAHADPAGDLPSVFVALGGIAQTESVRGRREVNASDFFAGMFETVLEPDEVITGVRFPVATNRAQHYEKFRRRMCDWAIVGSSVTLELANGHINAARVVLTNVGPTPMRAESVEHALAGAGIDQDSLARAAECAADGLNPTPELNASAEYKQHLACVITKRALMSAIRTTGSSP